MELLRKFYYHKANAGLNNFVWYDWHLNDPKKIALLIVLVHGIGARLVSNREQNCYMPKVNKVKTLIVNYYFVLVTNCFSLINSNQSLRMPPCYFYSEILPVQENHTRHILLLFFRKSYFLFFFYVETISLAILNNWCSIEGDISKMIYVHEIWNMLFS